MKCWFFILALISAYPSSHPICQGVVVAKDQKGFVLEKQDKAFRPLGFNYDHDEKCRLIENYWDAKSEKVERDFRPMKVLGANVVHRCCMNCAVADRLDGCVGTRRVRYAESAETDVVE